MKKDGRLFKSRLIECKDGREGAGQEGSLWGSGRDIMR